jgi:PAS domain S-box-containing protein
MTSEGPPTTAPAETEALFRALFFTAPDALLVLRDGVVVLANPQAEKIFRFGTGELEGVPADRLVAQGEFDEQIREQARIAADPVTRSMGTGLHVSSRRRDGSTFVSDLSLSTFTTPTGEELVVCSIRDASERIELEAKGRREALAAQTERAHRLEALGQLAGGVAHDFNNLLGVIMNYTTLLLRTVEDEGAQSDLGEIRAAVERASSLTRQLLTFARRDVVAPEPLEVNGAIRAAADMLSRTLGEHIQLELDLHRDDLVAVIDRHQLDQIVLNLAINARDAMVGGGVLTICTRNGRTEEGATEVVISVADDGIGMAPDVVERVFEPFFSTKPKGEGTGLGLSTVYGIVQQNGGGVGITSRLGIGTTVTVALPAAEGAAEVAEATSPQPVAGTGLVLLVEDEEALRRGTARLLEALGYEVLTAGDGIEALEVMDAANRPIDVVVTDVAMPRMRGDELAQRLEARHPDLPVIFMSGYDSGATPTGGRLLPKPVTESELLRALREVIDG